MGVKAKVFGPIAWKFLSGLAKAHDTILYDPNKGSLEKGKAGCYMRKLWYLLVFVLPCIYCRQSYQNFTNPSSPESKVLSIDFIMDKAENPAQTFLYNLHTRVNVKLAQQEIEAVDDEEYVSKVKEKWYKYQPTLDESFTNNLDVSDTSFWSLTLQFMSLVLCDFPTEAYKHRDGDMIYDFFETVYHLLSFHPNSKVQDKAKMYYRGLLSTHQRMLWNTPMDIDTVVLIVSEINGALDGVCTQFENDFEWKVWCEEAIVECEN
jgi:hypothetical protein